ncbi:MAG TPA: energy transducer TonB [Candidatus Acidoferrum sp.]|jgi:TonB family protein|nr:energy transducer TonB [Candidatus Acidoferrum sp.]
MTTMIADPPRKTTMGVGFEANRGRSGDPQAWKRAIGTKPVAARLALLPDSKPRWDRIGVSAAGQLVVLGFLLLLPLIFPERMKTVLNLRPTELMQPVTLIPVAPEPPPPPPPKVKAKAPPVVKPEVPEPVKLNPKQTHVFLAAKVEPPKVKTIDAKPVDLNPVFEASKVDLPANQPRRPKEDVKVGNLGSGSAAPATVVAPVNKVQTGGFGDPNGIPGKGDPNKATNVNRLGSPALPGGPGYGNGTGGDKGIRGTVASTGFGNGTANPPPSGGKRGNVQTSGFGDQTVAAEAPKKKAASNEGAPTSVEILEKPRPEYTAEGRSLKIEGDVVLEMVFLANGTVQVNRVVSGLGHGLDEAATRAAQQIKFKPAKRDGQPVDFPARVRIEFRMAY